MNNATAITSISDTPTSNYQGASVNGLALVVNQQTSGVYYLVITNNNIPGLKLTSAPIVINGTPMAQSEVSATANGNT